MTTLSARYDRTKLLLLLLVSILFTAASYGLTRQLDPFVYAVAYVAFVFFVLLILLTIYRLFDPREILRIDETGIYDRRIADQTIPWQVVEDVKEKKLLSLKFFAVDTSAPISDFITSRPKRLMAWANGKLGFFPVGINTNGLAVTHTELHDAFAAYAPEKPETDGESES